MGASLYIVQTGSLPVRAWCESSCICESESSAEFLKGSFPRPLIANHSHERRGQERTWLSRTHDEEHPASVSSVDLWLYLGSPGCRKGAGWGGLLPGAVGGGGSIPGGGGWVPRPETLQ